MNAPEPLRYILWRYGQDHQGEDHQQRVAAVQEWLDALPEAEPELDWRKAEDYLDMMEEAYKDIGPAGSFGLAITIMPLKDRLARGERTKWLYDEIMEVQ